MASEEQPRIEPLPGSLDLIVLRALDAMGPLHAYALASRLSQLADGALTLNQGTLYPALVRLEQKGWISGEWKTTDNNRDAKHYRLTRAGRKAVASEAARWHRLAAFIDRLMTEPH